MFWLRKGPEISSFKILHSHHDHPAYPRSPPQFCLLNGTLIFLCMFASLSPLASLFLLLTNTNSSWRLTPNYWLSVFCRAVSVIPEPPCVPSLVPLTHFLSLEPVGVTSMYLDLRLRSFWRPTPSMEVSSSARPPMPTATPWHSDGQWTGLITHGNHKITQEFKFSFCTAFWEVELGSSLTGKR